MAAEQLKLLKTERANAKRQLTTTLHVTEALISEENYDEIDKTKLYEQRVRFIDAHGAYGDALVNSNADIDEIEFLDEYVKQEMENYNRVLRASKPTVVKDEHVSHPAVMLSREEFYPVTDRKQGSHEMCARISENQCVVILLEKRVEFECYYFNRWTSVAVSLRFIFLQSLSLVVNLIWTSDYF